MEEYSQFLNTPNDTFSELDYNSPLIQFLISNEDRQNLIEWNPSNIDNEDFSADLEQFIRNCDIDDFPPSSGTSNGDLLSDLSMLDPNEDSYDINVSNSHRQQNLDLNITLGCSSETSTDVQNFDPDQPGLDCIKILNNVDHHQQNLDLAHTWATPPYSGTGLHSEDVNFCLSYQFENLVVDNVNHQNYNNIDKNYSSDIQNLDTHKSIINDVMLNSSNIRINEESNPLEHDATTNSFDETMEFDEVNLLLESQIENYSFTADNFFNLDFDLLGDNQILEHQLTQPIDLQNPNVSTIQPKDATIPENILLNKFTLPPEICVPSTSYHTIDVDKAFMDFFDQFTSSHSIDFNYKKLNPISQIVARRKANPVQITRHRRQGGGRKPKNNSEMPKGLTLEQQKNWKANKSCQLSRDKKKRRELEDEMRFEQLKTEVEQLDDEYLKVLEEAKILSKELINSYR